jgi:dTDP-glucose 4,6-dehydratase
MRIFESDLQQIVELARQDLLSLKGASIFLTGGTGYIGRWLLEGLCFANFTLGLELRITVLSRQSELFIERYPHLGQNEAVRFIDGDVRTFEFPSGKFTHAIHAATDVIASHPPVETFDVIVTGTKRLLEFCKSQEIANVLLLSSGAVYGPIPHTIDRVVEDYAGTPNRVESSSAYGIGKLASEWLGVAYSAEGYLACKSARVFAQIGPYLALDKQFAAGNFIQNSIRGEPILIKGDGTPLRSYMYGTDLFVWLLRILVKGSSGRAYNVGSDRAVSISELAALTAHVAGIAAPTIRILGQSLSERPPERYVPDITRAQGELGLSITVDVEDAMTRTIQWFKFFER